MPISSSRTFRIASFNMYKFSTNSSKDIDLIRQLIIDNEIDILAIQEIFSEYAKDRIVYALGRDRWDGRWASPNSRSASAAEGYAYIWNTNSIRLSQRKSGTCFEPVIHNQYPHKGFGELIRNPYYARFCPCVNDRIELRLINTHIMFSQKVDSRFR